MCLGSRTRLQIYWPRKKQKEKKKKRSFGNITVFIISFGNITVFIISSIFVKNQLEPNIPGINYVHKSGTNISISLDRDVAPLTYDVTCSSGQNNLSIF